MNRFHVGEALRFTLEKGKIFWDIWNMNDCPYGVSRDDWENLTKIGYKAKEEAVTFIHEMTRCLQSEIESIGFPCKTITGRSDNYDDEWYGRIELLNEYLLKVFPKLSYAGSLYIIVSIDRSEPRHRLFQDLIQHSRTATEFDELHGWDKHLAFDLGSLTKMESINSCNEICNQWVQAYLANKKWINCLKNKQTGKEKRRRAA